MLPTCAKVKRQGVGLVVAEQVFKARLPWEFISVAGQAQIWTLCTAVLTRDVFVTTGRAVERAAELSDEEWADNYKRAAEKTVRAIMSPHRALGIVLPLGSWAASSYFISVCEGLCTLLFSEMDTIQNSIDEEANQ